MSIFGKMLFFSIFITNRVEFYSNHNLPQWQMTAHSNIPLFASIKINFIENLYEFFHSIRTLHFNKQLLKNLKHQKYTHGKANDNRRPKKRRKNKHIEYST